MNINERSTIVVTGGAGLIGSTTIDLLLSAARRRASSSSTTSRAARRANIDAALRDPRVTLVDGDIRDRRARCHA